MASYSVETELSPKEAVERAVAYVVPEVVKLEMTDRQDCCAHFEGVGGFVHVTVLTVRTQRW